MKNADVVACARASFLHEHDCQRILRHWKMYLQKIFIPFGRNMLKSSLMVLLLIGVIAAAPAECLSAQLSNLEFQRFTRDQGLSDDGVTSIVQDSKGLLWFGTLNGLNRFDGYSFTSYVQGLSHRSIRAVHADSSRRLWVATPNGLNLFDPAAETFTSYRIAAGNAANDMTSICEDQTGRLWIGTNQGLYRFDRASGKFARYEKISDVIISAMLEDRTGQLWIGTSKGLHLFNPKTEQIISSHKHDQNDQESLSHNNISVIYEDSLGIIWVGTQNGLNRFDQQQGRFKRYFHEGNDPDSISHNNISSIYEDDSGTLWFGTLGGGLNSFDRKTERFSSLPNQPDPFIWSIFKDTSGLLWTGTKNGACKTNLNGQKFRIYQHDASKQNSLSNDRINDIAQDQEGSLWLATWDGIDKLDRRKQKFTHYPGQDNTPDCLKNKRILSVHHQPGNNILWFGNSEGLHRYNPETGECIPYSNIPDNPESLSDNCVVAIAQDSKKNLWVGTENGLNRLDVSSFDPAQPNKAAFSHYTLSSNSILAIQEVKNIVWVGTNGGGLFQYDQEKDAFVHYESPAIVRSIHPDKKKDVLWIGADAFQDKEKGGLYEFDLESKRIINIYQEAQGLSGNIVQGILQDDQGDLWLSTPRNGLAQFTPEKKTFKLYGRRDGLPSTEFTQGTAFKSLSDNAMFFGSAGGLLEFEPKTITSSYKTPVILTAFYKLNQKMPFKGPVDEVKDIVLSYKDSIFSFEFAALDYTDPSRNQYRYKLERKGDHLEWQSPVEKTRMATYTNVPPGNYVFQVQGSNSDGVWNKEGFKINVTITIPWWKRQEAFIVALLIPIIMLIVGAVIYSIVQSRNRKHAEELVDQLNIQKKHTEDTNKKLKTINKVGQELNSQINVEEREILEKIFTRVGEVIPSDSMYIALYDEKNKILSFPVASEMGKRVEGGYDSRIIDLSDLSECGLTEYVISSCKTLKISNVENFIHEYNLNPPVNKISKSFLGVPMFVIDKIFGVIALLDDQKNNAYQNDDQEVLEAIVGQAAVAIHNVRLFKSNAQLEKDVNEKENIILEQSRYFVHRMNNVAGNIPVQIKLALEHIDDESQSGAKIFKYMKRIDENVQTLLSAADLMKSIIKEKAGSPERIIVAELVEDVIQAVWKDYPEIESRITLNKNGVNINLPEIYIEKKQFQDTVENVIKNAVEAMPQGGTLTIELQESTVFNRLGFAIAVSDTGVGIPIHKLPNIFAPFRSTKAKGLGLGLWRDRMFLRRKGGDIEVRSQEGRGSTFTITLPLITEKA